MKVAIIGLGLLGASLGMALRGRSVLRLGWSRRPEVCDWACGHDVIDRHGELETVLAEADLTVLCLPIPAIMRFMVEHAHAWRPGSIVTDVGSVKACIAATAAAALLPRKVHYVGSHPMAGTEHSGPEAAFATLYDQAETFICPTESSEAEAVAAVEAFWQSIGTRTRRIGIEEHDELVAHTSHISHLLASALTATVLECDTPEELSLRYSGCATGFRDTSRIASSSPAMWREIIEHNVPAVLDAARRFETRFRNLIDIIETGDFDRFEAEFARGKELRDGWIDYKKQMKQKPS